MASKTTTSSPPKVHVTTPTSDPLQKTSSAPPPEDEPSLSGLLEILKFYRSECVHEFNLLGQRLSWFVIVQSFQICLRANRRRTSHYSREYVSDELERRHAHPSEDEWQTRDFHCIEIAADNYLLTYTLIQGARVTRRSTIRRRTARGWKIVYRQGAVVEDR
jgi:hypothetical protein